MSDKKKSLLPVRVVRSLTRRGRPEGEVTPSERLAGLARVAFTSATFRARLAAAERLRGANGEWCPLDRNGRRILALVPEIREFVPHGHAIIVDCGDLRMWGTLRRGLQSYNMTGPLTQPEVRLWGPSMFMLGRGVTTVVVTPGLVLNLHKESNVVSHNLEIDLRSTGVLEFDLYNGLYWMKFTFDDPRLLTFEGGSKNHFDNPMTKVTGDDLIDMERELNPARKRLPRS